jgi:hypothetical protein
MNNSKKNFNQSHSQNQKSQNQSQSQHHYELFEAQLISQNSFEDRVPWVDINGIRFLLKGKAYHGSRLLVYIESNDIETILNNGDNGDNFEFMVYTSLSEGGIFRFCIQKELSSYYIKGHDYVTETFIHMDLQEGIIANLDWIPDMYLDKCSSSRNLLEIYEERLYNIEPLQPFRLTPSGSIFKPDSLLYLVGNPYINTSKLHSCLKLFECDQEANEDYLKEINKFIQTGYLFNPLFLTQDFYNKLVKDSETLSPILFNSIISGLNEYLKKYLKIRNNPDNVPKKLFSWNSEPLKDMKLYSNYYKIDITINGEDFDLIFNHYFLENNRESTPLIKSNLIITNIIPKDVNINKYGVYDKFVQIGFLIYKPFEYPQQTNVGNVFLKDEYKYIGHYLAQLHPLNSIVYEFEDILEANSLPVHLKSYAISNY